MFGFKGVYVLWYVEKTCNFPPFVLCLLLSSFSDVVVLQFSHLFDNESTVFFAIFMGIWGK